MQTYLAQLKLPGSVDAINDPVGAQFPDLASVVNQATPIVLMICGLLLFGYLLWGGFDYLTAMGDPEKAAAGRARITYAVLGFVVVFGAYWLTQIISYMFGNLGIF